jgi:hypothetical protein
MDALLRNQDFMSRLRDVPPELTKQYQAAQPYPHAVLDDFFPADVLRQVLELFPAPGDLTWQRYKNEHEVKLAFREAEVLPAPLREVLYFLNSRPMLLFLEKLTGIPALLPDMSYVGGGLHQIPRGGKLDVHVDFNKLSPWNLDRRLNLILYLNRDWQEEYGGHFELWDAEGRACVKRVLPVFNRCVVFSTSAKSYHGHPHPLTCPEGWTRKSLAIYYYTNGRPDEEQTGALTTTSWLNGGPMAPRRSARDLLRYLTPPALYDLGRFCKRKLTGR